MVLVVIAALMRSDPWMEVILFAMVLIIAGIPAALQAVLSVIMSIGAGRLARWKAIVSKRISMEEMAGLEVLCADKTGNMTRVITLAAVLGVGEVIESFGLFWFITQYMGLPDAIVQTMMFLKLLVVGHLTIYLTRNRSWFWNRPWPSLGLFLTLLGSFLNLRPVSLGIPCSIWSLFSDSSEVQDPHIQSIHYKTGHLVNDPGSTPG